jgi:hypothetical protein
MRSPRRCRSAAALCLAFGVAIAGCGSGGDTAATEPTATEVTGVPVSSTVEQAETPSTLAKDAAPVRTPLAAADGPQAIVAVNGGALPEALIEGYAHHGGDLVDPAEWSGRFGRSALPELTGDGVKLVEGLRSMELRDGRWVQTDEAGWLAMSGDDRDSMMDSLRTAADIVGVVSTTTSTDQGADCVIDSYQPDTGGVSWQVQGCSYDRFPRLLSLGITRTGPTDVPPAPIDPTISTVAATIDASVTFVEVRLGEPGADQSTLRYSAHLTTQRGFQSAADAVVGGPLAGWQTFPGDGSLLLSGPSGATWTLSDGVAVFTWSGRW